MFRLIFASQYTIQSEQPPQLLKICARQNTSIVCWSVPIFDVEALTNLRRENTETRLSASLVMSVLQVGAADEKKTHLHDDLVSA